MAAVSIIDQIMELEAQKQKLMAQAKDEALKMAEKAVSDLNNLGFNYRLVEGSTTPRSPATSTGSTRTRRGGVADDVLNVIKSAPEGLPSSLVQEQLGATDKAGKQSIANALSNLKKKGQLTAENGVYRAV